MTLPYIPEALFENLPAPEPYPCEYTSESEVRATGYGFKVHIHDGDDSFVRALVKSGPNPNDEYDAVGEAFTARIMSSERLAVIIELARRGLLTKDNYYHVIARYVRE